jgi:glutathione S-transferase
MQSLDTHNFAMPVLYSFRRCPYAMRARLAILSANKTVEIREILLRDKPAHMVGLSTKATVPVLWFENGRVVDESIDVMTWALAEMAGKSDTSGAKWQGDRDLIASYDGDFKFHLDRYKYASRYEGADAAQHQQACLTHLLDLGPRLNDDWLAGDSPGFTDIAILPFIRQFRIADPTWFDDHEQLEVVQLWLQRFLNWPRFQAVMKKYPVWQSGQPGIVFAE